MATVVEIPVTAIIPLCFSSLPDSRDHICETRKLELQKLSCIYTLDTQHGLCPWLTVRRGVRIERRDQVGEGNKLSCIGPLGLPTFFTAHVHVSNRTMVPGSELKAEFLLLLLSLRRALASLFHHSHGSYQTFCVY